MTHQAPNVGAHPVDVQTLAGKVRLLVGDTDPSPLVPEVAGQGEYAWYSDTELEALGSLNGDSPKRTALWLLSMVAVNQALLLRKWTSEDLQVDGPAIAAGIEKTIARLSKDVEREEQEAASYFDLVAPDPAPRSFWWGA
jgi:hypothetical protein